VQSGQEIPCDEPFSLLTPHVCKKKSDGVSLLASNRHLSILLNIYFFLEQSKKELEENEVKEVSIFDSKVTVLQGHGAEVTPFLAKK
jgi:hypothetical protein